MYERIDVYERTFRMKYVDQELRIVKFLMKKPNKKRSHIIIITTAHNIQRTSLFKIIRARQYIENSIFHILVNSPMRIFVGQLSNLHFVQDPGARHSLLLLE